MSARYLLIGASGLVGSHVRKALAGREMITTSRRPTSGAKALDVTDPDALMAIIDDVRPSVVVLAAAAPHVEECERDPTRTRRVNVGPAIPLANAVNALGAALVVFSSEYVFDGRKGPYSEDDARAPLNEYGRQKLELEEVARTAQRHLILRTSGVFGVEMARKNFVYQVVDRLRSGGHMPVPSDQVITPTYAPSLAVAVVALLDAGANGTYHVAGPAILERTVFAAMVASAFGLDAGSIDPRPTSELGLAAPRPSRAGLATAKLRATLGRDLTHPADALAALAEAGL